MVKMIRILFFIVDVFKIHHMYKQIKTNYVAAFSAQFLL